MKTTLKFHFVYLICLSPEAARIAKEMRQNADKATVFRRMACRGQCSLWTGCCRGPLSMWVHPHVKLLMLLITIKSFAEHS